MPRRNISLPAELDDLARRRGLNVSALAQAAIAEAVDRLDRMAALDAWLDELDVVHGPPSAREVAEAEAWVRATIRVVPASGTEAPVSVPLVRADAAPRAKAKALPAGGPRSRSNS